MPVVDETGLGGPFDLTVRWRGAARDRDGSPNAALVKALRSAGFDLKRTKRSIDGLVIEGAEKPDEDR